MIRIFHMGRGLATAFVPRLERSTAIPGQAEVPLGTGDFSRTRRAQIHLPGCRLFDARAAAAREAGETAVAAMGVVVRAAVVRAVAVTGRGGGDGVFLDRPLGN